MATLNTVKPTEDMFAAGTSNSGDSFTSDIAEAIKNAPVNGDVIQINCETPTEARGIGRRVNKALEMLKLAEDSVRISKFDSKVASKLLADGKPIVRFIQRVK